MESLLTSQQRLKASIELLDHIPEEANILDCFIIVRELLLSLVHTQADTIGKDFNTRDVRGRLNDIFFKYFKL